MIHSRSYTYIIKNVYSDPTEVFDTILDDANIMEEQRALLKHTTTSSVQHSNTVTVMTGSTLFEGVYYAEEQLYETKRKLYKAVVNVNILEGIRFYVSFACSFAFW